MAVFFAGPLIIIVLLIVLLSAALFVVPQQQAYIIERFGKFLKVQFAGIHIRIPFVDRIHRNGDAAISRLA
jgi:regulator of protease activity HflC (stomatin/prohibitin superfamily)